jgi:hypothetical protein
MSPVESDEKVCKLLIIEFEGAIPMVRKDGTPTHNLLMSKELLGFSHAKVNYNP